MPGLKRNRVSPHFTDCGESDEFGYRTVADSFWRFWEDSAGTLTRILLVEAAAKKFGLAPDPFPSRFLKDDANTDKAREKARCLILPTLREPSSAQVLNVKLILPGRELDTYPPSSRESHFLSREWLGVEVCIYILLALPEGAIRYSCPVVFIRQNAEALGWSSAGAATRPAAAAAAALRRSHQLAVKWEHGSMSRTPLSWEEWGAPAYAAAKPHHDYMAEFFERSKKTAEAAAARLVETKARVAEVASLRRSRDDAAQQASDSAAAAATAAAAAAAQLALLQAGYDARIAAMESAAAAVGAGGAGGGSPTDGDASLCIVCLDTPRRVALQPCGHFSFCRSCADEVMRLGHGRCPVCRSPVKVAQEIFE